MSSLIWLLGFGVGILASLVVMLAVAMHQLDQTHKKKWKVWYPQESDSKEDEDADVR